MPNNHPPYFPLYVTDFMSSGKVTAMTTAAVGAYILLLCQAWSEEPPASIPNDDVTLARWARMSSVDWAECRESVLAAFTLGKDNRWHQKRLRLEHDKFRNQFARKSLSGKKGADKRWKSAVKQSETTNNMAVPCVCHASAIAQPIAERMANDSYSVSVSEKDKKTVCVPPARASPVGWRRTDIEELFTVWAELKLTPDAILTDTEIHNLIGFLSLHSLDEAKEAIRNYAKILRSTDFWYSKMFTFYNFCTKHLGQFLTSADPFSRFRKEVSGGYGNGSEVKQKRKKGVHLAVRDVFPDDTPR
jgi:uncharacterized protein YdaU (DUF1376 family)